MRRLEFRTEAVLEAQGGVAQFCTAFDALADLVIIMTPDEAIKFSDLLETVVNDRDEDKEFIFFTLRGAGRGLRSEDDKGN